MRRFSPIDFDQAHSMLLYWDMRSLLVVGIFLFHPLAKTECIIVDHRSLGLFEQIPDSVLETIRSRRILFMNRSVGANTNTALDCLTASSYGSSANTCRRDYRISNGVWQITTRNQVNYDAGTVDPYIRFSPSPTRYNRSNIQYYFFHGAWDSMTTSFIQGLRQNSLRVENADTTALTIRPLDYDIISFQFSYLNIDTTSTINDFFTNRAGADNDAYEMDNAISTVLTPANKKFIYFTTSLARGLGSEAGTRFNNRMRQWCQEQTNRTIILFDFADIQSHDMFGNRCYDNRDGVPYQTSNGVRENHPDDGQNYPAICQENTTEHEGGHLSTAQGTIPIAKGFWITMARAVGWNPGQLPPPPPPPSGPRAPTNVRILQIQ